MTPGMEPICASEAHSATVHSSTSERDLASASSAIEEENGQRIARNLRLLQRRLCARLSFASLVTTPWAVRDARMDSEWYKRISVLGIRNLLCSSSVT
jgi:hypothetical protein